MARNIAEFTGSPLPADVATPARSNPSSSSDSTQPTPPRAETPTAYPIPGGSVLAVKDDSNELVGKTVSIYNNFWAGYEHDSGRTLCPVVARCQREFLHPNGQRCLTYLIEYDDIFWPITHTALLHCLTRPVRMSLPIQHTF